MGHIGEIPCFSHSREVAIFTMVVEEMLDGDSHVIDVQDGEIPDEGNSPLVGFLDNDKEDLGDEAQNTEEAKVETTSSRT